MDLNCAPRARAPHPAPPGRPGPGGRRATTHDFHRPKTFPLVKLVSQLFSLGSRNILSLSAPPRGVYKAFIYMQYSFLSKRNVSCIFIGHGARACVWYVLHLLCAVWTLDTRTGATGVEPRGQHTSRDQPATASTGEHLRLADRLRSACRTWRTARRHSCCSTGACSRASASLAAG